MQKLAEEALEGITKEVLNIFKQKYIKGIVFDSHGANKVYRRTGQFESAWNFSQIKKLINVISTELWYDSSKLTTFEPESFVHGSRYSTPPDVRDNLQDILNKSGLSSSLWLSVKRSQPYWTTFLNDMFNGGELNRIVTKHFKSKGFVKI